MNYTALNPGIRKTVAWLNEQGFPTCDSGDGVTHAFECDQPNPYVHMRIQAHMLVSESKRLRSLLKTIHGVEVQPMDEACSVPSIEVSYNPTDPDDRGILTLWNVKL